MTVTQADLAYVAGVLDVLGNLTTRTVGHDTLLPVVQLNGRQVGVQQRFANLTGTRTVTTRRDFVRHGCAQHCAERHVHIVSTSGRWSVTGARATVLLAAVAPFLVVQAERAAELVGIGMRSPWKPATVEKMIALGWPVPVLPAESPTGFRASRIDTQAGGAA